MSLSTIDTTAPLAGLALCLACRGALPANGTCPGCGRDHPEADGILDAIGPLSGNNRVAADFYDGPGWVRFRPWEFRFLRLVGGRVRARREILRHLADRPGKVLEVGIGDGENVDLLARGQIPYGVDIARTQLSACLRRFPEMAGRLAWAEGEALPLADASFDACTSVGGFNTFRDPAAALAEMRRVTKPGGVVVVADERPDLKRFGIGHLIGRPSWDAFWLRRAGLTADFVAMVFASRFEPRSLLAGLSPSARLVPIWKGLGYALIEPDPSWSPS